MIKKITVVTVGIYLLGHIVVVLASNAPCEGWDCGQNIKCPDGYAIRAPEGHYVACEELEDYWRGQENGKR